MRKPRGCLGTAVKLLALGCAACIVIALPPALFGRDVARTVFQPERFSTLLKSRVLDSGLLAGQLRAAFSSDRWLEALGDRNELRPVFGHLSPAEREEILALLLPDGWLEGQFDQVVFGFFGWLDSDQPVPQVALDLVPLKNHLRSGGIDAVVEILVDSWPSCTAEGAAQLERELLAGSGTPSEYCEPSEPMRTELVYLAASSLTDQVDALPDRAALFEGLRPDEALAFKAQLLQLRSLALYGWFVPLSLFGVIMALAVRTLTDLRRWWGLPLLLSGAAAFVLAFVLSAGQSALALRFTQGFSGSGELVRSALQSGFEGVISTALQTLLAQSLLLIFLGLVVWFGLRAIARRREGAVTQEPKTGHPAAAAPSHAPVRPSAPESEAEDEPAGPPTGIFG